MNIIDELEKEQAEAILAQRTLPEFKTGDTVKVNVRVTEGTRTRIQAYEGVCIARQGSGVNESFTVRKISYGEGVERLFPIFSPLIESVEVIRRGKVRRAKLYYLRDRRGKSARIAERTSGHGIEQTVIAVSKTERKRQKAADKLARKEAAAAEREAALKAKAEAEAAKAAEAKAAEEAAAAAEAESAAPEGEA